MSKMFKKPPSMNNLVDSLIAPKTDIVPKNPKQYTSIAKAFGDSIAGRDNVASLSKPSAKKGKTKNTSSLDKGKSSLKRKKFSFGKKSNNFKKKKRYSNKKTFKNKSVSDGYKRKMLRTIEKNRSSYVRNDQDSLWERISKTMVDVGYPVFFELNLEIIDLPSNKEKRGKVLTKEEKEAMKEMELLKKLKNKK